MVFRRAAASGMVKNMEPLPQGPRRRGKNKVYPIPPTRRRGKVDWPETSPPGEECPDPAKIRPTAAMPWRFRRGGRGMDSSGLPTRQNRSY